MIYFNVISKNKKTGAEKLELIIKTNGLQFWTKKGEKFINPYFNDKDKRELFDEILNRTTILNRPDGHMVYEKDNSIIYVLNNDL